jgi:hypothetical protein
MDHPIRRPEEILPFRRLQQILAARPSDLWIVGPTDSLRAALHLIAEKSVAFLVVMDGLTGARFRTAGCARTKICGHDAGREYAGSATLFAPA